VVPVEGQPLAAGVVRLLEALDALGQPLSAETARAVRRAAEARDGAELQRLLDPLATLVVSINPESRVKVERGPGPAELQQAGFAPLLVKVQNQSTITKRLRVSSPQAGPPYGGVAELSLERQAQSELGAGQLAAPSSERFLAVALHDAPPLAAQLSGLEVEYAILLVYSSEAGRREATIAFDVEQGNQDLGFRGQAAVLFEVRPARAVRLRILDHDGQPTTARLEFRDFQGRVYPPQARRLAPDFFFQQQIYRHDGETVLLPPGRLELRASRGPEYRVVRREVLVPSTGDVELRVELARWVEPLRWGFFSGDHHIHGAGCAHYTVPTQGVTPEDLFRQVKGEGLNVGCLLTWGPCFEHQRQYFAPAPHPVSERLTLLKYDLEISGFGSQALGHVCLLNLRDQVYPGSEGTKTKGWPSWTTPVLRWAKAQGAVTGYAHSGSGLEIDPPAAAGRLLAELDTDRDGRLSAAESERGLLPAPAAALDRDGDGGLSAAELQAGLRQAAEELPNLAIPEMNGVGAMEICVSAAEGVCDFISAMDTPRIQEWNCWYHLLNSGLPMKVSGETDFPCMSSTRVGQGRVYVRLGVGAELDFSAWCSGLREGRSYVSDGYAQALEFSVQGNRPGEGDVDLAEPGPVVVRARVAFAEELPAAVAHGTLEPAGGRRWVGDTVELRGAPGGGWVRGGSRLVEVVVNGRAAASAQVPADGQEHVIEFSLPIERSSWVAVRQFPQLHTNPVNVLVRGAPIRGSRASARWCAETIRQLWRARAGSIAAGERAAAEEAFRRAEALYLRRGAEAPAGT
jgi:hypothetical protein